MGLISGPEVFGPGFHEKWVILAPLFDHFLSHFGQNPQRSQGTLEMGHFGKVPKMTYFDPSGGVTSQV
jgi:hypothetical protein